MTSSTTQQPIGGAVDETLSARPRGVLVVLVAMALLGALQSSVVVPLVAHIPKLFGVSAAEASWIVTSTSLGAAVSSPIISRMADQFGKRIVLCISLLIVATGSLMVALSDVFGVAIAGRTLQGLALALTPISMSIVRDVLPPHKVGGGIALLSGTSGLGAALGLPIAGGLYWLWGWPALFWVTVVAAPILAVAIWYLVPTQAKGEAQRFDIVGAALMAGFLTLLLIAVSLSNDWGLGDPRLLTMASVGVVLAVLWWLWERRVGQPLVDLVLLVRRDVALTNGATLIISAGMLANMYLASMQLSAPSEVEGGFGLSSGMVGLAMMAPASVIIVMTPIVGPLLDRLGGRRVLIAGALIMASGYLARVWLDGSVVAVVIGTVVVGIGISLGLSAQPMIIMSAVPANYAASANGINALCRTVGTAVSIALIAALTSVTSARFGGAEYATTQTYRLAFAIGAGALALAAVLVWLIPKNSSQDMTPVT